jgi:hypothetical protein
MSRVSIRFSDDEDTILSNYCKKHRRTKNDVVRELVRSLVTEQLSLPRGWSDSEFNGKIEGEYKGYSVKLYPSSNGYDVYAFNIDTEEYFMFDEGRVSLNLDEDIPVNAIAKIQTIIDSRV